MFKMTSCSNELSTEAGYTGHQNALSGAANLFKRGDSHLEQGQDEEHDEEAEEEEEEEEDVDFNPFLKETASLEASSSLSSEAEEEAFSANFFSRPPSGFQDYAVGDSEHGEEIVMQYVVSSVGACENESERTSSPRPKKRKSVLISQPENETFREKDNGSSSRTDAANDDPLSRKSIMDFDDEDAICMRTRARYSLASFTLDELETFLQESDDDDLHNVDDEEEYRKFLAAVLQGGDGDGHATHESENVDDEDEDNDADFELEIEEALESDLEEITRGEQEEEGRRPETRQNRRQKASLRYKKKLWEPSNRPLRPLLPNAPIVPFPALDGNRLMPGTDSHHLLSSAHNGFVNGFTPNQLGQLHCLIHEHVQLLIQVFSLCVLEHSQQHIASQVQELISEVLHKRDQVLSWRRVPYPFFSFVPPYIHPSMPNELSKSLTGQTDSSSGKNEKLTSDVSSPSKASYESLPSVQKISYQNPEGSFWMPFANGPILSVLDVAPLNLVGHYMDDISTALRDYQRRYVEATADTHFEREPLFPFDNLSSSEAHIEVLRGATTRDTQTVPYSPASDQPPKKTLAAALVERTKKQSVAPVPKEIAELAQRFFPLFNPALFPHKPPPAPVANRVLFTDAEDELLALGLMECNTDWKAIQQRFLPCKSKHQIFVRQKNRSSSKAPENPIKAVRRIKNSPLTAEERARIQEGLKVFKLDWMSVWRFVVPHRDPSLLPRQWRIAAGTQKSYKSNAEKKEKRRLYESNRRKCRPIGLASWQTSSEKVDCHTDNAGGGNNSGDDCVDNENEAYVHEAFLADWNPSTSSLVSSKIPVSILREKHLPNNFLPSRFTESQSQIGQEFPNALKHSQNFHTSSSFGPNHQVSDVNSKSSKSQFCFRPIQAYRGNGTRLVKLAPDLPPVNLPPSVRIMSQSAFTSYHGGSATENVVSRLPHGAMSGTSHQLQVRENTSSPLKRAITNSPPQKSGVEGNKCAAGEKGESDLQMHPLLFRAPEDGRLPYFPLNCGSSTCSSFNFLGGNQAQFNLSLFQNPHQASDVNCFHKSSKSKETTSSPCGVDFHPLLQRIDEINSYSVTTKCGQVRKPSDAVLLAESRVNGSSMATCATPSSLGGKANELDLEIHLSSTSREEKASGSRDGIGNVGDRNNITSNVGDLSLPEIVMEQEELSDSEEEDGEHVEFECEEMADSEGEEGSDYEQIVDTQDKEAPHVTSNILVTDADYDDQRCEASEHDRFQSNICATSEGTLKSGPIDQAKDSRSSSLSLSLNSCVPDHPPNSMTKTMHSVSINDEGFGRKLSPSSRSDRSLKKTTPRTKNVTSQAGDIQQQLRLGSLSFNPSRKPRKHPTRTRSSLTIGAEKRD